MKLRRRGFLGLLGAAVAAPFVPTPAVPAPTVGLDLASGPDVTAVAFVTRDPTTRAGQSVTCFGDAARLYVDGTES